jgi:hypothetical protein
MEEDLGMTKKEKAKKSLLEEASGTVSKATKEIDESVEEMKYEVANQPNVTALRNDVIGFLFDKNVAELKLDLKPTRLDIRSVETGQIKSYSKTDSFDDFSAELKRMLENNISPTTWLYYECEPEIRNDPEKCVIDFSNLFRQLNRIYQSLNKLAQYETQIAVFENKVLNDMQRTLMNTIKSTYENIMKNHRVTIVKGVTREDIRKELAQGILDLESLERELDLLTRGSQELSRVQRELFQASR